MTARKSPITGTLTALVTPFRDGKIDEKALRRHIDWQIESGVDGLVPCGTTGESPTLSYEEHHRVVAITVEQAAGRVAVVAGSGSNSTEEALLLTRKAKEQGADASLMITPYYNKPGQEGLYRHFAKVADDVGLPIFVYNIPGRTAVNVLPETMARLAQHPAIVGMKDAVGNLQQSAETLRLCPPGFIALSGDDVMTLPLMSIGGRGVISTTSNVAPREMSDLVRAFAAGDVARARELHYRLLPLFTTLFIETNPIPVKAALAMMGRIGGEIRLPMTPMADAARARLARALTDFGIPAKAQ
jgi:4-hydroxy-tetrahydrodipicolinate synthase